MTGGVALVHISDSKRVEAIAGTFVPLQDS